MEGQSFYDFVKKNKKEEQHMIRKPVVHSHSTAQARPAVHMRRTERPVPVKQTRQLGESNTILAESEEMLYNLQEKLQQVFYRFGMAGLERIDEAIIRTCKELMNPGAYRQDESYDEPAPRRAPVKMRPKQQVKRPATAEEIAAAALRGMEPLNPNTAADVSEANDAASIPTQTSENNPYLAALSTPTSAPADYMEQFKDANLSPEELATIEEGLAQEATGMAQPSESDGFDDSSLTMLGQALQK